MSLQSSQTEAMDAIQDLISKVEQLQRERDELKEQVKVGLQIAASFFEALKPLNLKGINVADPGTHVTALITERDKYDKLSTGYYREAQKGWIKFRQLEREIEQGVDNLNNVKDLTLDQVVDILNQNLHHGSADWQREAYDTIARIDWLDGACLNQVDAKAIALSYLRREVIDKLSRLLKEVQAE